MIDTHCHLNMVLDENGSLDYVKIEQILNMMKIDGVNKAIVIGSNLQDSALALDLSKKYDNLYCAVGVHPDGVNEFDLDGLEQLVINGLESGKLVAIGEIGLDYYWTKDTKDAQKNMFIKQINLANKYNLPIVVHCRDAYGDCLEILKSRNANKSGVIHCYSGSIEWAKEVINLGYLISFAGVVTFPSAVNIKEVAKWVDDDKFMVETDSPFLSPVPFRGQTNDPSKVKYVAEYIASLRNVHYNIIDNITTKNAEKLFNI